MSDVVVVSMMKTILTRSHTINEKRMSVPLFCWQAFSMVEGCVTDLPLGREEAGSLRWLGHLDHDHHPDAVACRLKLSLAAAPCPEMSAALPWDVAEQVLSVACACWTTMILMSD